MNRARISVIASITGAVAAIQVASTRPAYTQSRPDLVVLIAVDRFSAALFDQWRGRFKSGLKRLMDEGIVYSSAYQSHGLTETCAGHSTMLTGKHPRGTGIVANEWFDTKDGDQIYCVEAPAFSSASDPKRHVGPTNLLATTLGDWMKDQQPMSRVVAVSGKDRASITMAGHRGDGVFWYEDNFGFTTYLAAGENAAEKLAPVAELNVKIKAETASPPLWTYFEDSCRALEADYQFGAKTWHSKLPPENPSGANVRPVHLIDPYTMEAARILVDHFHLGQRGVTDLLAVSLSATDFVGHGYGTQGPEMCDHLYRLDAQIGAFLTFLDGLGPRVLVVMTGDHGGSDFVERLVLRGFANARRIDSKALLTAVNDELKSKFSLTADPLVTPDFAQFYAVDDKKRALGEPLRTKVIEAALGILNARQEVEEAFSLKDLLSHKVKRSAQSDYSLRDRYALSVMDGRSGDIIVAFKSGIATGPALPTGVTMFALTFLGTSASVPSAERNHPGLLVEAGSSRILVDCGEGTQRQLLRSGAGFRRLDRLLLTHGHFDHVLGIPGLFSTLRLRPSADVMTIHSSPGTLDVVVRMLAGLWGEGRAPIPLEFVPLTEGQVLDAGEFTIGCFPVRHRDTDSFGFSFESQVRRHLRPDRLAALRVPDGPVRKELAEGRPVTLADGRMVDPKEVLGPPEGRKNLVIVGDAEITNGLAEHARDADVLVIEATFLDRDAAIARDYGHLTAAEAAALAAMSNVKQLILTHISGRYADEEILAEARKTFPNSPLAMDFDHIVV